MVEIITECYRNGDTKGFYENLQELRKFMTGEEFGNLWDEVSERIKEANNTRQTAVTTAHP